MSRLARDTFAGPTGLSQSIASVWEILINVQSGKLKLPRPAGPYVLKKLAENGIEMLSISIDHLLALERLPMHHHDPFDRILIAQSLEDDLPIVTSDPLFARYDIPLIW
jgi:PIN domain nuclease of toxin-antitoxin system